jgi:hypothetical protein
MPKGDVVGGADGAAACRGAVDTRHSSPSGPQSLPPSRFTLNSGPTTAYQEKSYDDSQNEPTGRADSASDDGVSPTGAFCVVFVFAVVVFDAVIILDTEDEPVFE